MTNPLPVLIQRRTVAARESGVRFIETLVAHSGGHIGENGIETMMFGNMRVSGFWLLLGAALLLNVVASGKEMLGNIPIGPLVGGGIVLAIIAVAVLNSKDKFQNNRPGLFSWFMQEFVTKDLFFLIAAMVVVAAVAIDLFHLPGTAWLAALVIGSVIIGLTARAKYTSQKEEEQFNRQFSAHWRDFMRQYEEARAYRGKGARGGAGSSKSEQWSYAQSSAGSGMNYQPRSSDDPFAKKLYDILEVEPNADAAKLKSAYRKLAMKWHPDKNRGNKAAEDRFKEINTAYEVLSDGEGRAFYDRIHGYNQKK